MKSRYIQGGIISILQDHKVHTIEEMAKKLEVAKLTVFRHISDISTFYPRLKRNAYFILDEFGNLPKMENLDGMVTVARSRGIRFLFVLQSFAQLAAKYGKEIAEVVKSNCNEFVP